MKFYEDDFSRNSYGIFATYGPMLRYLNSIRPTYYDQFRKCYMIGLQYQA